MSVLPPPLVRLHRMNQKNVPAALERARRLMHVTDVSTFYGTAPVSRPDQPPFLNGVWRIETLIPPRELKFAKLRVVEEQLHRVRTGDKFEARTIDLDILLYGEEVIDEPDLRVPDPDIRTRPFVWAPLLELRPDLVLPDTHERLEAVTNPDQRRSLDPRPDITERLRKILRRAPG